MYRDLIAEQLGQKHVLHRGCLPKQLVPTKTQFEELWRIHPQARPKLYVGKWVTAPRWQQSFEKDYVYSGQIQRARPGPLILRQFLNWAKQTIDTELNGILVNWYAANDYIGKHRDSTVNMVHGAPIVTISLGEERVFRLRPWKTKGFVDFLAKHGAVFVIPFNTNLAWTHEVPRRSAHKARRISITMRALL